MLFIQLGWECHSVSPSRCVLNWDVASFSSYIIILGAFLHLAGVNVPSMVSYVHIMLLE